MMVTPYSGISVYNVNGKNYGEIDRITRWRPVWLTINRMPKEYYYLLQEFYQIVINIMNNIRVAAMKAVKNQFNSHNSIASGACVESML